MSVLLPAPFSPRSTFTSPGRSSSWTSSRATTPGNRFVIPDIRSSTAPGTAVVIRRSPGQLVQDQVDHGAAHRRALGGRPPGRVLLDHDPARILHPLERAKEAADVEEAATSLAEDAVPEPGQEAVDLARGHR